MPNGGSDCCGTCWFNRSLEGQRGSGNFNRETPSHCEIRDLDIPDPFYTYCANHPCHRPGPDIEETIGLFESGLGLEQHPSRPCAIPCLRPVLTVRPRTGTGHRVRRSRTLFHDRIEGTAPVFARVVHHDIDEYGHENGQDCGAIAHLIPVDPAVPGRAAVDELVAKDVEPVEHEAQDLDGIPRPQGSRESTLRVPEPFPPVFVPADTVVVLPERVEHIAVVQKHADGSREVVPYGVVHPLTGIQSHYLSEVAGERGPLPGRRVVELLLIRIGRVEADPQEDEPSVVVGCVFGPVRSS